MKSKSKFISVIMLSAVALLLSACGPANLAGVNSNNDNSQSASNTQSNITNQITSANEDDISVEDAGTADISGFVWDDTNSNGIQDEGEVGVAGVLESLRQSNGTLLDIVYTDSEGIYTFADIPPGEYYLRFTANSGQNFTVQDVGDDDTLDSDTNPESGKTNSIAVAAGSESDQDAGLLTAVVEIEVQLPQIVGPNPEDFPPGYNPLTGLPADDPSLMDLRPIFISISHFPPSQTRPTTGISFSPYVVELTTLHGQTRLFVLFWGEYPDVESATTDSVRIEGVRSGRVFYEDFRRLFNACTITGGSDPEVAAQIYTCAHASTTNADDIGAAGLSISRLQNIAEQSAIGIEPPNLTGNLFDPQAPAGGQPAPTFLMFYNKFNQTKWVYDAELGGYLRYQNNIANIDVFTLSTDLLTGEPIVRENVIVLFTKHHVLNEAETIVDIDLEYNRGPAVLFRDGMMYKILWDTVSGEYEQETGRLRPIRFTDLNGNPFPLKPGTLWINVVDLTTGFWELEPGIWKARFYQPEYEGG
ncbi:MAG: DUF3048 C-terminal domain-containing protein [Chloroflexi bacterium]|nr:DUF3048 C-terminal domain-containing protein [Chloroflexota bacterium]